jgi:hypothetical protein
MMREGKNQSFDEILENTKIAAATVFLANGSHAPQIVFSKHGQIGFMLVADMQTEDDKDGVAAILDNFRRDCDIVCFVSEAWVGKGLKIKPRDHPERKEVIVIVITAKTGRREVWTADIIRERVVNLGDWVKMDGIAGGRMV